MNYLNRLKEKCNLNNEFMDVVYNIFNKLIEFGYITSRTSKILERRLYENIDVVLFDADVSHDYKTGYYDAVKKELYIKDIKNIESITLRILYAMTTTEISKEAFNVGYSTAFMSNTSYKIIHKNFGINRAVVSNLACRLLYTVPTTLSIVPTYRTYENDFLGNKISSDNDIYFLEGKLLSEICFAFNIDEEDLYFNLFTNPKKYLNKFLAKIKLQEPKKLLELFDIVSRKYSNYNKLIYLNKLLDTNYIEIKKHALSDDNTTLLTEKKRIKLSIKTTLEKLSEKKIKKDTKYDDNIELSLSEEISKLEEIIIKNIVNIQNILVDTLIENELNYATIPYVIKLKTLEKILLVENSKLKQQIYNVITYRVLNTFENTASNLIEKIKYSIANEVLSSDKYIKIYKDMKFKRLFNLSYKENTSIAAISVDNSFLQLVEISSLNRQAKFLSNNAKPIHLDSFGYLLNNLSSKQDTDKLEKIYTNMKSELKELSDVSIENVYMTNFDLGFNLIVVAQDSDFKIIKFTENGDILKYKLVKLSESYSIFNQNSTNTNLPIAYKKNMSSIKKMFTFFISIFS